MKLDETGLHSEDCDCPKCDIGLRPTELERAAARRALAVKRAADAARAAADAKQKPSPVRLSHTVRPMTRVPPPMTAAELEAMRRDLETFKNGRRP